MNGPDSQRPLDKEISFFGGKGGVGKTTLAAAHALMMSRAGHKTLLVSTDPAHSTSHILESQLTSTPSEVTQDFWALEIDPQEEADLYISGVKERLADSVPPRLAQEVDRQVDVARVSPGAEESAIFERFTRILEVERGDFERIVFDTAPTGHTLRLLSLPELMSTWISGLIGQRQKVRATERMWRKVAGAAAGDDRTGRDRILETLRERQSRFANARSLITDPARSSFVFVITPERLPILETSKAVETLTRHGIPIGAIFVNRVLPPDSEGTFWNARRDREALHLDRIRQSFPGHALHLVPLMESDIVGLEGLEALIRVLEGTRDRINTSAGPEMNRPTNAEQSREV